MIPSNANDQSVASVAKDTKDAIDSDFEVERSGNMFVGFSLDKFF
jgi:hypothetical protein